MLPAHNGEVPLESWLSAIGEDTALVHVTHVFSENSRQQPVAEIAAHCRRVGALCVVDIAQSVGVVPINLADWQADFVTGSCLKWLCGGPGAGFLWVSPRIVDSLAPQDVGWFSHEAPFEFDISRFEYRGGALRFWGGTPSVLPFAIAAKSISMLLEIGVAEIRRINLAHTGRLIEAAESLHIPISTPRQIAERGGTIALKFADGESAARHLQGQGIRCDARPRSGVRLSPHVYVSEPEIAKVCAELGRFARQGGIQRQGSGGQITL
jgi:selenocysteine lyase/cysteine desulfurase